MHPLLMLEADRLPRLVLLLSSFFVGFGSLTAQEGESQSVPLEPPLFGVRMRDYRQLQSALLRDAFTRDFVRNGDRDSKWNVDVIELISSWGLWLGSTEYEDVLRKCQRVVESGCVDSVVAAIYAKAAWNLGDRETMRDAVDYATRVATTTAARDPVVTMSLRAAEFWIRFELSLETDLDAYVEAWTNALKRPGLLREYVAHFSFQQPARIPVRSNAKQQAEMCALLDAVVAKLNDERVSNWCVRALRAGQVMLTAGKKRDVAGDRFAAKLWSDLYAKDPTAYVVPLAMLSMANVLDMDEREARTWFDRCRAVIVDSPMAYEFYIRYLEERPEAERCLLSFAIECAESKLSDTRVPLRAWQCLERIARVTKRPLSEVLAQNRKDVFHILVRVTNENLTEDDYRLWSSRLTCALVENDRIFEARNRFTGLGAEFPQKVLDEFGTTLDELRGKLR
ncbi:MAG: hypothetical protein KDC95_00215 [Planctomycetes bacterium]|nr:hypothetical protein [Planctomycetota bacterium]